MRAQPDPTLEAQLRTVWSESLATLLACVEPGDTVEGPSLKEGLGFCVYLAPAPPNGSVLRVCFDTDHASAWAFSLQAILRTENAARLAAVCGKLLDRESRQAYCAGRACVLLQVCACRLLDTKSEIEELAAAPASKGGGA